MEMNGDLERRAKALAFLRAVEDEGELAIACSMALAEIGLTRSDEEVEVLYRKGLLVDGNANRLDPNNRPAAAALLYVVYMLVGRKGEPRDVSPAWLKTPSDHFFGASPLRFIAGLTPSHVLEANRWRPCPISYYSSPDFLETRLWAVFHCALDLVEALRTGKKRLTGKEVLAQSVRYTVDGLLVTKAPQGPA